MNNQKGIFLFDVHENILARDAEGDDVDAFAFRILRRARLRVKHPRVPWTHHAVALQPTLTQRSLPVRTCIVERQKLAAYICQAYRNALYSGLAHLSQAWSLGHAAQPYPLRHYALLSLS